MRVISLLAHEFPSSAIQTIRNVIKATKPDIALIHWSAGFQTDRLTFQRLIKSSDFECLVMLNPNSIETKFLNILGAHISNAEFALNLGGTFDSQFIMQASNDYYLLPSDKHLDTHQYLFQQRDIQSKSFHRLSEQPVASRLRRKFGHFFYSQPEGTSYPLQIFLDARKELTEQFLIYENTAAEEILIPSLALASGVIPTSTPTIFSEVIRSELHSIKYWNVFNKLGLLGKNANLDLLRRIVEELALVNLSAHSGLGTIISRDRTLAQQIRNSEITSIIDGTYGSKYERIREIQFQWDAYTEGAIFGIKRLPRNPDDPARTRLLAFIEEELAKSL